jgi:acyl-CoA synthetase (AMP-forming)/AMP-acid ligase II
MRLHDYLDYHARRAPRADFAVQGDRSITWAEALAAAERLARGLVAAGLEPGARVGLLARNCLEYPLFFFGCSKAGVVPVPLNYRLAAPELGYILEDSGARLLFATPEYASGVLAEGGAVPSCVGERILVGAGEVDGWSSQEGWLEAGGTADLPFVDTDADLYQMYTSGTTGRPKGAILTQRAVTEQIVQINTVSAPGRDERFLIVAPMYHAAATMTAFCATAAGATLYIHEDFVPQAVVDSLDRDGITRVTLVPAMIQACLVHVPDVARRSYESLGVITYGASPIAEHVLRRAIEVFGCGFSQGYGMTETSAVLTYLEPADHQRALAGEPHLLLSAGRAIPGTEVRVVDGEDRPLPLGTIGEICGRGPQLMRGYWNLPEASEAALAGGWMHTGDAGTMDEEGFVYIQDRTKDMVVSGGENVYPREVEDVLFQHPAVADAAVIGVPDERWGEAVKAVVVLRSGESTDEESIIEFCQGRLAGYKRPRSVDFVDELPRNPSGKVLKRILREKYWQGQGRQVS